MKKRLKAEDRRKQIIKCAIKVFAKSNYKATRVADIATEAGISEAAIYKYFAKKENIFLEILEHISRRVIMVWEEKYRKNENVLDVIRDMSSSYYFRMVNHPDELKLQFQAISEVDSPKILERLHEDHEYYLGYFAKILKRGIRQGVIRKDLDLKTVAWIFNGIGILINMAHLLKFDKEFGEKELRNIAEHMIKSIRA
jgi:AcrR family transcriptional regulator